MINKNNENSTWTKLCSLIKLFAQMQLTIIIRKKVNNTYGIIEWMKMIIFHRVELHLHGL